MNSNKKHKITRRKFIKLVGSGIGIAGTVNCIPHVDGSWESCEDEIIKADFNPVSNKVVEIKCEDSVIDEESKIVQEKVITMFKAGLLELTDKSEIKQAWNLVFPNRTNGEKIGLKINTLNPYVPTSPELLKVMVDSLKEEPEIPAEDIFIWDRSKRELEIAGIDLNSMGVDCIGTIFSATNQTGIGYESEPVCLTGRKIFLSKILTRQTKHLINVSVMKNHFAAGFTGCLKNHYGSFSKPFDFHDGCEEHIANLNTLPAITNVTRLHVMDAFIGVCLSDTNSPPDCVPKRLLMSFDPVAIDKRGEEIRNEMRVAEGAEPVEPAEYLNLAKELGLGNTEYDLKTIEI